MAGSSRYIRSEAAEIVRRLRGLEERPSIREDKITGEPRVASAMHGITRSGACITYPTRPLLAFPKKSFSPILP
jgi:hypothetical protein